MEEKDILKEVKEIDTSCLSGFIPKGSTTIEVIPYQFYKELKEQYKKAMKIVQHRCNKAKYKLKIIRYKNQQLQQELNENKKMLKCAEELINKGKCKFTM